MHVQASLFESVALLMGQHLAGAALTGIEPPPMPERGRTWSVYELFAAADGRQIFLGLTSDRHWRRFCAAFGFTDWAVDPTLATNQGRIEASDRLLPELRRRLGGRSFEEILRLADQANIPFAPVNRPVDLWQDPHLSASGGLVETESPDGKMARLPKLPLRLDGHTLALRLHPPRVGEGGVDLLRLAGLADNEIASLAADGIIAVLPSRGD
jgi:crotonobetainyl-CoA:carnitine CoA-transferase CaiB-like acyl-CoA transferase